MKKIIAVLLSLQLITLSIQPAWAQRLPARQLGKAVAKKGLPAGVTTAPGRIPRLDTRLVQLDNALLTNMRLPLSTQYTNLLQNKTLLVTPQQILAHANPAERALLLRSDFVAMSLTRPTDPLSMEKALAFYRANINGKEAVSHPAQTAADIASIGLFGTAKQDAQNILKAARATRNTPAEPVITAAAARALLRLEAYGELTQLAGSSSILPDLWEGLAAYAEVYKLPVEIPVKSRKDVSMTDIMTEVAPLGPINTVAADPSTEATFLYMNAGREATPAAATRVAPARSKAAQTAEKEDFLPEETDAVIAPLQVSPEVAISAVPEAYSVLPQAAFTPQEQELAALVEEHGPVKLSAENQGIVDKTKQWLSKLLPKSEDDTKFSQRAALYLTAFSIGLEIGTPIMASIKSALNLPLSFAILVTAATYSPYLFGSFFANWVKGKIGRKGTINTGIAMMAGSFALGATVLGLDGSFTAWENPVAQYLWLLGVLTVASTGSVFIHNATGPVMTEISKKANELVRQQRGTYIELSRSIGMMASFGFPFIATSMLGMDWSAPFLLALPIVGASALALNLAKIPNTKFVDTNTEKVRTSKGKLRSTTSYLHLLREAPGVGSFISGLFIMNAVEMGINSGFLFMLPQLTGDESQRYLMGMIQFSIAFLAGRFLAKHFLKWFPKRNLSIATTLAGLSAVASLGVTHNMYALTAALFMAELGISTTFTLAFARTAKNQKTQDKITSLIMASAVACAVGPLLLTTVAQVLMGTGFSEAEATVAALIGIPAALTLLSAKLFRRTENKTVAGLADGPAWKEVVQNWWEKVKSFFH